ncbi:MAG TPA: amidohydrolase family protein, partial [Gemmatimonadaceae bacterium]|nr:amidohydrolase family protein [Gemmatimonadaceae bacterium]
MLPSALRPTASLLAALIATAAPTTLRAQGAAAAAPADLVITGGRIYTVDAARPVVEAMAVRDGKVLFTGSRRGALALRGPRTRVLELGGRTVIPGMTDAHAHFLGLGTALRTVDLTGTRSYDEVIRRVQARARELPAGSWIVGRGWDQNDWGNTAFPTHDALSRAVPDHPVYLTRVDGHAGLANALAMQKANVTAATRDPSGGRLERGANGAPTGVFVDNAQELVGRVIPSESRDE